MCLCLCPRPVSFTWYLIPWLGILTGWGLLIWMLMRHHTNLHTSPAPSLECSRRSTSSVGDRFMGDTSFYGLGIRLGFYMQWIAQFWVDFVVKTKVRKDRKVEGERKRVLRVGILFQFVMLVGILLLVFGRSASYSLLRLWF